MLIFPPLLCDIVYHPYIMRYAIGTYMYSCKMCLFFGSHLPTLQISYLHFSGNISVNVHKLYIINWGTILFFAFLGKKFTIIVLIFTCFRYPFFIMRIMLAAIDHNMHLFRGSETKADGTECGHRKYSKRTKKYHAEPVKQDKEYYYFPFLIARMLKERSQFEGSFTQRTDDNAFNPKQIAPTLGMKEPLPTEVLMKGPSRFEKPTK